MRRPRTEPRFDLTSFCFIFVNFVAVVLLDRGFILAVLLLRCSDALSCIDFSYFRPVLLRWSCLDFAWLLLFDASWIRWFVWVLLSCNSTYHIVCGAENRDNETIRFHPKQKPSSNRRGVVLRPGIFAWFLQFYLLSWSGFASVASLLDFCCFVDIIVLVVMVLVWGDALVEGEMLFLLGFILLDICYFRAILSSRVDSLAPAYFWCPATGACRR